MFKFKNADRQGSEFLKKYGYVELGQFQPAVLHDSKVGQIKGYFCANCKYAQDQEGTLYNTVCTKMKNAEIAPWGCCNLWEYMPHEDSGAEPEADSSKESPLTSKDTPATADGGDDTSTQDAPDAGGAPEDGAPAAKPAASAPPAPKPAGGTPPAPKPTGGAPAAKPAAGAEPASPSEPNPDEEPANVKKLRERIQLVVRKEIDEILRGKKFK